MPMAVMSGLHLDFAGTPNAQTWDNGLVLIKDFVSEEEEATIIASFQHAQSQSQRTVKPGSRTRISQHFGYHFDYTTFGASETVFTPLPGYMHDILTRLPIRERLPDQFTIQYYPPGGGIPPHVDTHSLFDEAIYSLSLGSAVPMEFRACNDNDARKMRLPKRSLLADGSTSQSPTAIEPEPPISQATSDAKEETTEVSLPPRSLLIMLGPSRYGYTHGIRGRKTDKIDGETVMRQGRYSITMRTVRRGSKIGCDCDFPGVCDAKIAEERRKRDTQSTE